MNAIAHLMIAAVLWSIFSAAIWPLPLDRYFIALFCLVALVSLERVEAAPTDEQCSSAARIAVGAFEWRQAGITEEVAMGFLRHQKVYSGLPVWAVKQAYEAPADVSLWVLRGHVFGTCREREE